MTTDILVLTEALADRYAIEREAGAGGMATVYLARDLRHDRRVALKVLHPDLAAALGAERFLAEIRTTAKLQHPHILPLHDSGDADGLLFYVMPFVEGETLRARLEREGPLPIHDALRIAREMLGALDYAHRQGVIHRDVKPENILLHDGSALVADFGIALAVQTAGGQRMTQTGLSLGTPQYMSPEQAMGEKQVDARADVYAAGAVLYEMITGEPPFSGGSVQAIVAKVMTERPTPPSTLRDTVQAQMEAAVLRALAKLPADRFASAARFADALGDGALHPTATRVASVPRTGHLRLWKAATAVAIVAGVAATWLASRREKHVGALQIARQLTFDGTAVGAAISPDGAWLAYVTNDCLGKDYRCGFTLQLREVDGSQSVKLATWPSMSDDPSWVKDGGAIVIRGSPDSAAGTSQPYVIDRLGGSPRRIVVGNVSAMATGPGGSVALATSAAGRQSILRFDAVNLARIDSIGLPPGVQLRGFAYSPDGRQIAVATLQTLVLLDARGRMLDSSASLDPRRIVRWDTEGTGVYFAIPEPGVATNLYHLRVVQGRFRGDRAQVALGQVREGPDALSFDIARSGRVAVVTGPGTHEIRVANLGTSLPVWKSIGARTGWLGADDISPDGQFVAGSATHNMGDNLALFPMSGEEPRPVTAVRGLRFYPRLSADGRHMAYPAYETGSRLLGLAVISTDGGTERVIRGGGGAYRPCGWVGNDRIVICQDGANLTLVDTMGVERDRIVVPDSLAMSNTPRVDATSGLAAYWSSRAGALMVVDFKTKQFTRALPSRSALVVVGWGHAGDIYVQRTITIGGDERRRQTMELGRIGRGASTIVPVTTIPAECRNVVVGAGGRLAACSSLRFVPDVWLADAPGKSGW